MHTRVGHFAGPVSTSPVPAQLPARFTERFFEHASYITPNAKSMYSHIC